jgi:hypothetical protein
MLGAPRARRWDHSHTLDTCHSRGRPTWPARAACAARLLIPAGRSRRSRGRPRTRSKAEPTSPHHRRHCPGWHDGLHPPGPGSRHRLALCWLTVATRAPVRAAAHLAAPRALRLHPRPLRPLLALGTLAGQQQRRRRGRSAPRAGLAGWPRLRVAQRAQHRRGSAGARHEGAPLPRSLPPRPLHHCHRLSATATAAA